jgi:hypothetical protein
VPASLDNQKRCHLLLRFKDGIFCCPLAKKKKTISCGKRQKVLGSLDKEDAIFCIDLKMGSFAVPSPRKKTISCGKRQNVLGSLDKEDAIFALDLKMGSFAVPCQEKKAISCGKRQNVWGSLDKEDAIFWLIKDGIFCIFCV